MYAKVEKDKYQKVTGNARAAILIGRFIASVISQLLVSFEVMNLRDLNFLTLGGKFLIRFQSFALTLNKLFSSNSIAHRWCFITISRRQPVLLLSTRFI